MGGSAAVATALEILDDLDPTGLAKTRTRGLSGLHQWKRSYKWLTNPSTARHEFSEETDFLMTWPVTTDFWPALPSVSCCVLIMSGTSILLFH